MNTDSTGSHFADDITVNADGSFVAVWSGAGPGGDGNDVFFRRFGADGTPLDSQGVIVSAATAGVQDSASVSADGDGNFAIAWTDYGRDTAYNRPQSFVRLFDANGVAQTGDIAVETQDIGNPWSYGPQISMAGNGTFDVAYQTSPSNLDNSGTGGPSSNSAMRRTTTASSRSRPSAARSCPTKTALATRPSRSRLARTAHSSPCTTPRAQRARQRRECTLVRRRWNTRRSSVPVATGDANQQVTAAGFDASGNLTVSWQEGPNGGPYDNYVRPFDPTGTPLGDAIRTSTTSVAGDPQQVPSGSGEAIADPVTATTQSQPTVGSNANDATVAVWVDGQGVVAQRLSPQGAASRDANCRHYARR